MQSLTRAARAWRARRYDTDYALRVCRQAARHEACVLLLQGRGQHEEAFELALRHGLLEMARQCAGAPADDELRRRLWLRVLAADEGGLTVHGCMRVLAHGQAGVQADGSSLLRLEHVLPLLDDFVVVGDLKELVCESLAGHAASCAKLRKVLDAAVGRASSLRSEIQALRESEASAAPSAAHSHAVVFPCGHAWDERTLGARAHAACPLCSEDVVRTIDAPFILADEMF